ncbi:MAG: hypothetical protein N3G21_11505 [Candidatus Hydrogenedentes bacterium]|nr:hypothetical protein [Candidatus Hydrogenedentota bacterium]
MTVLIMASWICFLGLAIFLMALWWFDRRERRVREHRRVEISELAMIFQTLRDVVSEQKLLAKEFNENLEEKIGLIRKLVNDAKSELAQVEDSISKWNKKVQDLAEEVELILCRVGKLEELLNKTENSVYKNITGSENILLEIRERLQGIKKLRDDEGRKELHVETDVGHVTYEDKSKEEFKTEVRKEFENSEEESQISKELDNIKPAYDEILGHNREEYVKNSDENFLQVGHEDDKKLGLTPTQKMVLEYHRSGMTTAEISKELGIPKGEVRLILSLALAKVEKSNREE